VTVHGVFLGPIDTDMNRGLLQCHQLPLCMEGDVTSGPSLP
jgi:hypothetical protein